MGGWRGTKPGGDVEIAHSMWPEEQSVTGRPRRPHRCGECGGKKGPNFPVQVAPTWQFPRGRGSCGELAAKTSQQWGDRCNKLVKGMREEETGEGRRWAQPQGRPRSPIGLGRGRREGMVGDLVSLGGGAGEWLSGPPHSTHSSVDRS